MGTRLSGPSSAALKVLLLPSSLSLWITQRCICVWYSVVGDGGEYRLCVWIGVVWCGVVWWVTVGSIGYVYGMV